MYKILNYRDKIHSLKLANDCDIEYLNRCDAIGLWFKKVKCSNLNMEFGRNIYYELKFLYVYNIIFRMQ